MKCIDGHLHHTPSALPFFNLHHPPAEPMSQHDEPQEQERWKRARFQDCVAIPFPTSTTDDDGLHCLHGHAEVDSGEPTFSDKMDAIGTGDLSEAVEATLSTQTFEPFDYLYRNYKEWHVLEMLCGMPPGSAQYGVFTDAEKTHITGTLRQRVDRRAKKMQPGYKRSKHVVFCPTFQAAYEHLATEFEEKRRLLEAASALEPRSNTATEQARRNLDEWTAELHNLHFGCYYHIDNYLPEGTRNNTCRDVLMLMVANHLSQPQAYTILLYYLVRSPLDDVNDRLRLHIVTRAQSLHSTRFDQLLEAGDPRYNRLRCTFTQTKQERDRLVERTAANEVVLARMFKGMRAEQVSFKEKGSVARFCNWPRQQHPQRNSVHPHLVVSTGQHSRGRSRSCATYRTIRTGVVSNTHREAAGLPKSANRGKQGVALRILGVRKAG